MQRTVDPTSRNWSKPAVFSKVATVAKNEVKKAILKHQRFQGKIISMSGQEEVRLQIATVLLKEYALAIQIVYSDYNLSHKFVY